MVRPTDPCVPLTRNPEEVSSLFDSYLSSEKAYLEEIAVQKIQAV